jgi:hypothetical protein
MLACLTTGESNARQVTLASLASLSCTCTNLKLYSHHLHGCIVWTPWPCASACRCTIGGLRSSQSPIATPTTIKHKAFVPHQLLKRLPARTSAQCTGTKTHSINRVCD